MTAAHGLLHAYTDLRQTQASGSRTITRGSGVFVFDDEDNEYLEGVGGLWCTALGWGEEELVTAATRQLETLSSYHIAAGRATPPAIELADRLLDIAPGDFSRVFFTNSGSEANDTQVKLLWLYNNIRGRPEKKKVISRRNAYHGATIASASLGGISGNLEDFDLPLPYVRHVSAPRYWEDAERGESEEAYAARCARELEDLILAEGPETVAAFIAEPVIAAGGILPPPRGYFREVQRVLDAHDVRLIVDEVICGYGRLGEFWGSEHYDLQPAGLTIAKAMTSGYMPMGAVLIDGDMHAALLSECDRIGSFNHGFTFSGHPVAAAVALRTLELYEERDLVAWVKHLAPIFERGLFELAAEAAVHHVRSVGLLGGIELARPAAAELTRRCEENGLLVRALGADTIALCPPLVIDEVELELLFGRLRTSLREI